MAEKKVVENTVNSDITIDEGFARLNDLLADMEAENIGLEASFDLYKQGIDLVKILNDKLDQVEGKLTEVSQV